MLTGMFHLHPYFYLNLLYDRHRYFTDLVNDSRRTLERQYERLAKIETAIVQRYESQMPRKQKKQLQWSRAKTKRSIQDIERQQFYLRGWIRHYEEIMGACAYAGSMSGWNNPAPQLPYPVTPFSAISTVQLTIMIGDCEEPTKYWDLSILRERGGSAASVPSADSGFYEPSAYSRTVQHDLGSVSPFAAAISPSVHPRQDSFHSENGTIGELCMMPSPTKVGAEVHGSRHNQRRYSENAMQLIESRIASPKGRSRVRSVDQIPSFDRVMWNR